MCADHILSSHFTNEHGRKIVVQVCVNDSGSVTFGAEGPSSAFENTVTRMEAVHLWSVLGEVLGKMS